MNKFLSFKRKFAEILALIPMGKLIKPSYFLAFVFLVSGGQSLHAQFVHPGGVHNQQDLDRMKVKVAANASPWIDGWNLMIADSKARNTYVANPSSTIGGSGIRQQAARDATAAYFNTLRWYITGDTTYANCAVRILNAWSGSINQVVSGELFQLPIMQMVQVAELLRMYPGWVPADFNRFKNMCLNYFYPACHNFLGGCGSWPGWDAPANACIMYIGILCDDQAKFDEAVSYYKTGAGGGNVLNAIFQPSGQITEMGRDQPHAEIGPTVMAEMCQSALNQGVDLFSFSNNRLLAGFEYFCKFNLNNPVNWIPYNDCDNHNFMYLALSGQNRISQAPAYELVYNHYVIKKGLNAPFTRAMINLRGLKTITGEYVGYCGLTYTLADTTTVFLPKPIPIAPTGLSAIPGVSNVVLKWEKPAGNSANGYTILRSNSATGSYTILGTLDYNTSTEYIDRTVTNGTTYYYKVSAKNQSGTGPVSGVASAKPVIAGTTMPSGWIMNDIGTVASAGSATYANVNNQTFITRSSGTGIGGSSDSFGFLYTPVTGDFTLTTRLFNTTLSLTDRDKVGIMMRESLAPNAKMLTITLADAGFRKVWLASRVANGGAVTWQSGNSHTWLPVWFRLQRIGNTFTAYQSSDGQQWFVVGVSTVAMSNTYYAGFSSCPQSSTAGVSVTSNFDHISTLGGNFSAPAAPSNFTGSAISSSKVRLTWTPSVNATGYKIKRSVSQNGPYMTLSDDITDTAFVDNGLNATTGYHYVITASNFAGISADSSITNVLTPALALPLAPTGINIQAAQTNLSLSWDSSDEASGYIVKRAIDLNGPFLRVDSGALTSYIDNNVSAGSNYYYKVSGYNVIGEGPDGVIVSSFVSHKLQGVHIGTPGSYNNNPAVTFQAALDSNMTTFFDANLANGAWVGIDVGAGKKGQVRQIKFAPRIGKEGRMVAGKFQGANLSDFTDAVTLFTVTSSPTGGMMTEQGISNGGDFRYLRYLSPNGGSGNVAEVEFWGRIKNAQTLTFDSLTVKAVGGDDFDPGATASSGMQVTYSSSNPGVATIVNNKVHMVGAGTTIITAYQTGTDRYLTAVPVNQELKVFLPPVATVKNLVVPLNAQGAAVITAEQVNNGSLSHSGTLSLTLDKTAFSCSDIGSPVPVILTVIDQRGFASSATAQITVVDTIKPILQIPETQFFCHSENSYLLQPLVASDNCTIASVSYSINGVTERSGSGYDASGVFNAGVSFINWIVTDIHGNVSNSKTVITVGSPLSSAIPDQYALSPSTCEKNTLYNGYGPSSLTFEAMPVGGTAPFFYLWDTGATTKTILVSTAGLIKVTVTDAKGCQSSTSISVQVLDVRCGSHLNKVKICHNGAEQCVSASAVQAHLNHGDKLGACAASTGGNENFQDKHSESVLIYPSPVSDNLNITLDKVFPGATIKIYTISHKEVFSSRLNSLNETFSVAKLIGGIYLVVIKNGSETISRKIQKN